MVDAGARGDVNRPVPNDRALHHRALDDLPPAGQAGHVRFQVRQHVPGVGTAGEKGGQETCGQEESGSKAFFGRYSSAKASIRTSGLAVPGGR